MISHRRIRRVVFTAVLALALLPTAQASATSPWWQVVTTSRPTNLGAPKSEVQELQRAPVGNLTLVTVEENVVACMGSHFCTFFGFPDDETAAQLQTSLEAPYGTGAIEVTEAPPSSGRFLITGVGPGAGRYLPPITVETPGRARVLTFGGSGRLVFTAINLGDAPLDATMSPLTLSDALPAGVSAYGVEVTAGNGAIGHSESVPAACAVETTTTVSCTFAGTLAPYEAIQVEVFVSVTGSPGAAGVVSVSGANAPSAGASQRVTFSDAPTPFGIESLSVSPEAEGGAPATQAGSHPFQLTTALQFNQGPIVQGKNVTLIEEQPALPRNLRFRLPAGLVGDPTAVPRCSDQDFYNVQLTEAVTCPDDTVIGVASVSIIEPQNFGFAQLAVPVFNLTPARGEPARFGFEVVEVPVVLDAAVRGSEAYGVTVSVKDTSQAAQLLASTVTLWGTPGDPRHDQSRGWGCVYVAHPGGCSASQEVAQGKPFLRLPTSCGSPLGFGLELEPWNVPPGSDVSTGASTGTALDGCNREPFEPSIDVEPDTHAAEAPSGLTVHLKVPQGPDEAPEGISESDVRNTTVTLPAGLHINPAAANGLQACSEAQMGFSGMNGEEAVFDEAPISCPEASKLGRVKITSPLLEEPVTGWVYQAAQGANPFDSLLALYVVAEAPNSGIRIKLAGKVDPGRQSGQVVSTFAATPQLPFDEFELDIFGGAGAPLATSTCGAYKTATQIEPWSGGPAATPSSEFQVSGCAHPQPFAPSFSAGAESPLAGFYSPFVLNVTRKDGEGQLSQIDAVLPPGLTGRLAGIAYCPESAIHQAEARSNPGEGRSEQASPSCPSASQVGTVRVGAGVGPQPYNVDGSAYLAGPYKGAPLSLVIVTPAVAGPFDLGSVVVRTALYVDEETTQITAKSDPLPTILQGIPLDVRSIALKMDRSNFTLNPTSCEAMAMIGTATSTTGQSAALSNRFQVGGCKGLNFAPRLALKVFGKTNRNAKPRLRAVLRMKSDEANIRRAQVTLPHSLFLEQNHIKTVCTRVQWNAGGGHGERCPKGAIYGHARAVTPLLDKPLEGPVYLRSNGGERKLPDLVAALNGQIDIALWGKVDSGKNHGLRNTFEVVPDAPVSKFVLEMRGGRKGLLVNSENLCSKKGRSRRAIVRFTGQNGKVETFKPKVANSCEKGGAAHNPAEKVGG